MFYDASIDLEECEPHQLPQYNPFKSKGVSFNDYSVPHGSVYHLQLTPKGKEEYAKGIPIGKLIKHLHLAVVSEEKAVIPLKHPRRFNRDRAEIIAEIAQTRAGETGLEHRL